MQTTKKLSKLEKEAFYKNHFSLFRKSGFSQKEYCRRNHLSYWTFNNRLRDFENKAKSNFIEVHPKLSYERQETHAAFFEIILSQSLKIKIPENYRPEELLRLLQTLQNLEVAE